MIEVGTGSRCQIVEALIAVETIHRAQREEVVGEAGVAMD